MQAAYSVMSQRHCDVSHNLHQQYLTFCQWKYRNNLQQLSTHFEPIIWQKAEHEINQFLREFILNRPEIQLFKEWRVIKTLQDLFYIYKQKIMSTTAIHLILFTNILQWWRMTKRYKKYQFHDHKIQVSNYSFSYLCYWSFHII